MAKARRKHFPRPRERERRLLLVVLAGSVAAATGLVWLLWGHSPGGKRAVRPEDGPAIDVAEKFLNHWSRFEYGEALLLSTGEARRRVLLAMEKELSLDDAEMRKASSIRSMVEDVRLEVRARSVQDRPDRKVLEVTAFARYANEAFEREQTFHMRKVGGLWKVVHWDTGTNPQDKRR